MATSTTTGEDIAAAVRIALAEDRADADITAALIDADAIATARITCRDDAVLCGRQWADATFACVDPDLTLTWHAADGDRIAAGTVICELSGSARGLFTGERTALNFLQTLSATATAARRYADLVAHTSVQLLDTRKTIPGLRHAQKYAVTCGGCGNHRMDLEDAFLIKENHIAACGGISAAISRARSLHADKTLEIEVESLIEFREALDAAPDIIMLDNFSLADLASAVAGNNANVRLEASGGIETDADLVRIAETGVDFVSIGALTKHVRAVDLSMRID